MKEATLVVAVAALAVGGCERQEVQTTVPVEYMAAGGLIDTCRVTHNSANYTLCAGYIIGVLDANGIGCDAVRASDAVKAIRDEVVKSDVREGSAVFLVRNAADTALPKLGCGKNPAS